jgi:hypothetical protein
MIKSRCIPSVKESSPSTRQQLAFVPGFSSEKHHKQLTINKLQLTGNEKALFPAFGQYLPEKVQENKFVVLLIIS